MHTELIGELIERQQLLLLLVSGNRGSGAPEDVCRDRSSSTIPGP